VADPPSDLMDWGPVNLDSKIIAAGPLPTWRARKRDSGERTMGVASRISISMDLNASRKSIAAGPIPPRAGTDRSICSRTMGGGSRDVGAEKVSLQDLYPPAPARIVPSAQGRWGVGLEMSAPKKYRCGTYTPSAGEERDSAQRTMGWGQW
jgi:hypothetical protein